MLNSDELGAAYEQYKSNLEQLAILMHKHGASGDPMEWALSYGKEIEAMQERVGEAASTVEIKTDNDDAGIKAVIIVGSADRARKEVRSTLKKLDALLLKTPYEFQDIRLASEEVVEAISILQQKNSILERANKS